MTAFLILPPLFHLKDGSTYFRGGERGIMRKKLSCKDVIVFVPFLCFLLAASVKIAIQTKSEPLLCSFCLGIVVLSLVVSGIFIGLIHRKGAVQAEKLFPFLAIGLGLLYLFAITPFSVPDELTHYKASYEISNYLTMRDDTTQANAADFDLSGLSPHNNTADAYRRVVSEFFAEPKEEKLISIDTLSSIWTLQFFPEYLPQAIGITAARIINLNFLQTFFLGRLFNLLFYVFCLSIAIKRVPRFKTTFGMIGTLPMALQQAASYSYDSYINGLALVFIASVLKACFEDARLSKRDYIILLLCALLLAPAKGAYSFLVFLYLLIPSTHFSSRKRKYYSFFIMLIGCCSALMLVAYPEMARILSGSTEKRNTITIQELFHSGFRRFLLQIYYTMKRSFVSWFEGSLGKSLSGLTLIIPSWMIWSMALLLVLSVQNNDESSFCLPGRMRAMFILVSVLVLLSFLFAMTFSWSDKASSFIEGVQGRYFTPILPILLISLNNQVLILKKDIDMQIATGYALASTCVLFYIVNYTTLQL